MKQAKKNKKAKKTEVKRSKSVYAIANKEGIKFIYIKRTTGPIGSPQVDSVAMEIVRLPLAVWEIITDTFARDLESREGIFGNVLYNLGTPEQCAPLMALVFAVEGLNNPSEVECVSSTWAQLHSYAEAVEQLELRVTIREALARRS